MSIGIQVENLPGDAGEQALINLLSAYGEVRVVQLVRSGAALSASSSGLVW